MEPKLLEELYTDLYTYEVLGAFGLPRKTFGEEGATAIYVPNLVSKKSVKVVQVKRTAQEFLEETGIDRNRFVLKVGKEYNIELQDDGVLAPLDDRIYIHTFEPFDADRANAREILDRQRVYIAGETGRTNELGELDSSGQFESTRLVEVETRNDAKKFLIQYWRSPLTILQSYNEFNLESLPFFFQRIYAKNSTLDDFDLNLNSTKNNLSVLQLSPVSVTKDRVEYYLKQADASNELEIKGNEKFFGSTGANLKEYLTQGISQLEMPQANFLWERLLNILVLQYAFNSKFSGFHRADSTGKLLDFNGNTKLGVLAVAGINESDNIGEINNLILTLPFDYPQIFTTTVYKRFLAIIKGLSEYIQTDFATGQGISPQVMAEQLVTIELLESVNLQTPIKSDTSVKVKFKSQFLDIDDKGEIKGVKEGLRNISKTPAISLDQVYQWNKLPNPIVEQDLKMIGNATIDQKPFNLFFPYSDTTQLKSLYQLPTQVKKYPTGTVTDSISFTTDWYVSSVSNGTKPSGRSDFNSNIVYNVVSRVNDWGKGQTQLNYTLQFWERIADLKDQFNQSYKAPVNPKYSMTPLSSMTETFLSNFGIDSGSGRRFDPYQVERYIVNNLIPNGFELNYNPTASGSITTFNGDFTYKIIEEDRTETGIYYIFDNKEGSGMPYRRHGSGSYNDIPAFDGFSGSKSEVQGGGGDRWIEYAERRTYSYKVSRVVGTFKMKSTQDMTENLLPLNQNMFSTSDLVKRLANIAGNQRIKINFDISQQLSIIKDLDFVGAIGLKEFTLEMKGKAQDGTDVQYKTEPIYPPSSYDETISEFKISLQ